MSDKKELSPIESLRPTEKSLMQMVDVYKDRMLKRASDELRKSTPEKHEQFLARTVASIIKNENLKDCFNSPEGKVSIYMLIDDCLKTGLELDKHAYAVPYNKKSNNGWVKTASFQINKSGFKALLCGGEKPIFKNLLSGIVYEKEADNVKINRATGDVDHPIFIGDDRGKPVGVWVQAIKLDDTKETEFYPMKYIYGIRDNHSKTYNDYLSKKLSTCAWITDEIQMIDKTALKAFCRPYADVCEALQSALYSEGEEIPEPKKNVSEVAEKILDNALDNYNDQDESDAVIIQEPEQKKDNGVLF
jgi:recombinational DNA repair protein RecT